MEGNQKHTLGKVCESINEYHELATKALKERDRKFKKHLNDSVREQDADDTSFLDIPPQFDFNGRTGT